MCHQPMCPANTRATVTHLGMVFNWLTHSLVVPSPGTMGMDAFQLQCESLGITARQVPGHQQHKAELTDIIQHVLPPCPPVVSPGQE